jgi:hypothetical protein
MFTIHATKIEGHVRCYDRARRHALDVFAGELVDRDPQPVAALDI